MRLNYTGLPDELKREINELTEEVNALKHPDMMGEICVSIPVINEKLFGSDDLLLRNAYFQLENDNYVVQFLE